MSADWFIRGAVIAAITVIDVIWMWAKGIGFATESLAGLLSIAGIFLACCLALSVMAQSKTRLSTVLLGTSAFFCSLTQLLLMAPPVITLSYLAASRNLPFTNALSLRASPLLGSDVPSATTG